jgi:hypothetical protein
MEFIILLNLGEDGVVLPYSAELLEHFKAAVPVKVSRDYKGELSGIDAQAKPVAITVVKRPADFLAAGR